MYSLAIFLRFTTLVFILNLLIQTCTYRTYVVSAASTQHEKQHQAHHWHSRVKRTPPIPFPLLGPGRFGPAFRSFPSSRPPPFGFDLGPGGFAGPELFGRGFFRQPFGSSGFPRSTSSPPRRSDLLSTAPVIIETPDGSRTVFIRDRDSRPNRDASRGISTGRRGPGFSGSLLRRSFFNGDSRLPESAMLSSNLGTGSNPLPTCTSSTVLRCRSWPTGRNPATAHRCYGDCPGRICLVNCVCTCDTEQSPRIMLARMIGLGALVDGPGGSTGGVGIGDAGTNVGDLSLVPGNRDLSVSGTGGRDAGLPIPSSPVISADSSVMGIPISLAESAASLPSLGIADVNIGTNPEPEVSFVSALDVASSVNVGLNNGAVSSTNPVVALEASSGKIEVDLKAKVPSLKLDAVPELDVSPTGLKAEGLRVAGLPVPELEIRPLPDSGLSGSSNVLDQSLTGIGEPNNALDASLEFANAATNVLVGPIDTLISGTADSATIGSAPKALSLTLPAPGPAPTPPLKTNMAIDASQLATTVINTKNEGANVPALDKALHVLSNAKQPDMINDLNSLNSLFMALSGQGAAGDTASVGLDKKAVMSAITGKASAPLDRLDLLVKDLGLSALFPGGRIDRLFASDSNSSLDGLTIGNTDASTHAMLQSLLSKGIDGQSGTDNAELALLAAAIGNADGNQNTLQDAFARNIISSLSSAKNNINSAVDVSNSASKGSVNNQKGVSQKALIAATGSLGNGSAIDQVHGGATTKECLSRGLEIWCDPVTPWEPTPGVTKWCLLNCRDKNNCDRKRCSCVCVEEKVFRVKFEKLPIKSP